jgi:hypothetical protein
LLGLGIRLGLVWLRWVLFRVGMEIGRLRAVFVTVLSLEYKLRVNGSVSICSHLYYVDVEAARQTDIAPNAVSAYMIGLRGCAELRMPSA